MVPYVVQTCHRMKITSAKNYYFFRPKVEKNPVHEVGICSFRILDILYGGEAERILKSKLWVTNG